MWNRRERERSGDIASQMKSSERSLLPRERSLGGAGGDWV